MDKKLKGLISKSMVSMLSLSTVLAPIATPVMASELETIKTSKQQEIQVEANVSSSWTVTIPKTVNLTSDAKGSGEYSALIPILVNGDIATNEEIEVTPEGELVLVNQDNTDQKITAELEITKTIFNRDDALGIGSNSCGPDLPEKYRLNEEYFLYNFYLKFVRESN